MSLHSHGQSHADLLDDDDPSRERDQYVHVDGVTWETYEALLEARGDSSVPRITFLDGTLEIMAPGYPHEGSKTNIARLLERWSEERGIFLHGIGSWTIRTKKKKGGAEPDECYFVDKKSFAKQKRPDIAIEVVFSSGGLDKLEVWRRLDVPEVWMWRKQALEFHVLIGKAYRQEPRSALLPDLDPRLIAECMTAPTQPDAIALLLLRMRGR